jgi:hypothetical protein
MSADTSDLTKVDSAIGGMATSPPKETKRRTTSSAPGVMNINDLGMLSSGLTVPHPNKIPEKEGAKISVAVETQKTGW